MNKYIDADKLKAKVKELNLATKTYEEQIAFNNALAMVVEIIDSLQQEQTHFVDASKMEQLKVDSLREWSMRFAPDIRDAIEATAYHFWNLAINARKEK